MKKVRIFAEKSEFSRKSDLGFIISVILLLGLGLVTLYGLSVSNGASFFGDPLYFIKRQLFSCFIGLVFLVLFSVIDMNFIRKILPFIFIGTLLLCVLVLIPGIGDERNGARRWLKIPFVGSFQPSEFAKFAVVLFLANFFDKKHELLKAPGFNVAQPVLGLFTVVLVVYLQDDFSTSFFILLLGFAMFFLAGLKLTWFIGFGSLAIPAAIIFIFTSKFRLDRLNAYFSPELYSHGLNYQRNSAIDAIKAGGFWGNGFGSGLVESVSIPEVQNDYIFAGWAEAMGFFGVILYFVVLAYFAWRGYSIAFKCTDKFRSYTAFGIVTCIVFQSLLNCGVVCGAFPSTGIPLPFFSSGGSSMIITLLMCGVVINISKYDEIEADLYYE